MSKRCSQYVLVILVVAVTMPATLFGQGSTPEGLPGNGAARFETTKWLTAAHQPITLTAYAVAPPRALAQAGGQAPRNSLSGGAFVLSPTVIAGGGGTSSGGSFALTGTIGQPAAGSQLNSASFTLTSGFWSAFAESVLLKRRRGQVISQ